MVVTHALARAGELAMVRRQAEGRETSSDAVWHDAVHGVLWRRDVPDEAPDPSRRHVSGHTPRRRARRLLRGRMLQIDTGCVYGGRLTAWCVEAERVISVPARQVWWG